MEPSLFWLILLVSPSLWVKQLLRSTEEYYTLWIHLPLSIPRSRKIRCEKLLVQREIGLKLISTFLYPIFFPTWFSQVLMENCLKCQRGRQDVTSKRAHYPSEFEEIRQSLIHAVHILWRLSISRCKEGPRRMWELLLENHCQLFLGISFLRNERLAPRHSLLISQLAHFKFPIPFMDSLILSDVARAFCRAFFFLIDFRCRRLSSSFSSVHNILLSLVQTSPTYLCICSFIHSFCYKHSFIPFSHS